ncbi:hypothetical protein MHU86_19092 [Fragilaria crotonensis]|nr:hypothetical protein MHU86_19092 [Fragilaria crotonensis]
MASPTPTSDPVTASPTPPVSDPIVASDRPDKPIMGNIVSLSRDDWSAWTGGKPAPGWVGLDPAPPTTSRHQINSALSMPPPHKGYNFRRTGMTTLFTQASSLLLRDDERRQEPLRYTVATAKTLSSQQILRYDKYDKSNDLAATKFLLSSLDPALMSKIKEKMDDDDSFHVVWLQLIKTIERFEDLKAAIKARHPSQYAGENLEALAADYRKDARELTTAGQYDHNLTLTMLKTFLLAGGAGNEDFRFPLRSTKQRLDQALLDIGYKEKSGAHAHMVAEKLTFQDICRQAEDAYRTQFDRKEWPPASHAPDVRAPSATFGNVATAPAGISRAEVLTLIQSQASGTETTTKKGNCHKCGKPGHWANKCPELNRKSGSSSPSGSRQDRTNKHKSWRTIPPLPGTSNSKKVKDKTFNCNLPLPRRLPPRLRSLAINVVVSRLLKVVRAPPRFNSGIRANKLHRSYPLRLRQQGYVASRPPTVAERNDFRHFATLKERALRLQRRADKLRNSRRPAPLPPTTGQKGEGYKNKRSCSSWCSKRPRSSPRTAKYCPVAPANSPDPFAIAPLTFHQRAAANKILSHVHWRAIPRRFEWLFRLPLVCEKPSDPKQTRAPSFGTRAQAFRSRPTSPISKAPSRRPERSRS